MPQHKRITINRVEPLARRLSERYDTNGGLTDLLRLLAVIDATLVKHEHTDIARRLRKAFDKLEDES